MREFGPYIGTKQVLDVSHILNAYLLLKLGYSLT
jgi:hypothetical protein